MRSLLDVALENEERARTVLAVAAVLCSMLGLGLALWANATYL